MSKKVKPAKPQAKTVKTEMPEKFKIFNILFFLFLAILPFVYDDNLADSYLIPRQIYLSVFLSIVLILVGYNIFKKNIATTFNFLKLALPLTIITFLFTILISFFQAIVISESIYFLSKFLIFTSLFILTSYLLISEKLNFESIVKGFIVLAYIAVAFAGYSIYKLYISDEEFFRGINKIYGTFGNKNLLASGLFLCLAFVLNGFTLNRFWKIVSAILIVLVMIILWIVQTKAVIAALAITFVVLSTVLVLKRKLLIQSNQKLIYLFSGVIFLVFISAMSYYTLQNKDKFVHIFSKKSATSRLMFWENTGEVIKENFVFGVGAGNFSAHFPKHGLDKFTDPQIRNGISTLRNPHNDFLWIFSELGLIGILAYLGIFAISAFYLVKMISKTDDKKMVWKYGVLLAILLGYMFVSLVDFPLERMEHQIFVFLILGIICADYYKNSIKNVETKITKKFPYIVFGLLISVFAFSFVVSKYRHIGETHAKKIYAAQNRQNWNLIIKEAQSAENFFYKVDHKTTPISWYKGIGLFSNSDFEGAKVAFEQAYQLQPYNIRVMNNLASTYAILQETEQAIEIYRRILEISPRYEEALLNLSAAYFNLKDFDKAFETINMCDFKTRNPSYKPFLLAILKAWTGELILIEENPQLVKYLSELRYKNNGDDLLNIYQDSRTIGTEFASHLRAQIN